MSQNLPENILCAKSHEYIKIEGNTAYIGISQYATEQLGEVVFVELPEVGIKLSKGEIFGTVESVKAASELYMPVSGTISDINSRLTSEPELVNEDCYEKGWIIKISDFSQNELESLLSIDDYLLYIEE